jgi:hypothetical protein
MTRPADPVKGIDFDVDPYRSDMTRFDHTVSEDPPTREEFDALVKAFYQLERTVYGVQQMLGKAAEYQGKPRGRLPR